MYIVQSNCLLSILLQFIACEFLLFFQNLIYSRTFLRKHKELGDFRENKKEIFISGLEYYTVKKAVELLDVPSRNTSLMKKKYISTAEIL